MPVKIISILLSCMIIFACGDNLTGRKLKDIDSLLIKECADSALTALEKVQHADMNGEDMAYFNLLKSIVYYKQGDRHASDSLADLCVKYYTRNGDDEKLARAYYQKGTTQDEYENISGAFMYVKKAERIAVRSNNSRLRHDINIFLCYLNNISGNLNAAVQYANKALDISMKAGDRRLMGQDYLQLSSSYYYMGKTDSSDYYIDKLIPYLKYQLEKDIPNMLNNIAVSKYGRHDTAAAKNLLAKSLSIRPQAHTYYLLAEIYSAEGNGDKSVTLWQKALKTEELYMREGITRMYARWLREHNDYKAAAEMLITADSLKGVLAQKQMGEKILTMENDYAKENISNDAESRIRLICIYAACVVCLVVALWGIYYYIMRRSASRLKRNAALLEKQIETLENNGQRNINKALAAKSKEIRELKTINAQRNKELKKLKTQMRCEREQTTAIYEEGLKRYDELFNEGRASQWNKADATNFLAYFYHVNPDFLRIIRSTYENLSPNNEVVAILMEMGKSKDEIKSIFGLSDGALRTMKSRLNSKRRKT